MSVAICANPKCRMPFEPRRRSQGKFAGTRTIFCQSKCWHAVRQAKGIAVTVTARAREALMEARRRRMAEKFREAFGSLSSREVEIIRMALRHGYQRGYMRKRRQDARQGMAA